MYLNRFHSGSIEKFTKNKNIHQNELKIYKVFGPLSVLVATNMINLDPYKIFCLRANVPHYTKARHSDHVTVPRPNKNLVTHKYN